jgi:hypothetical protein
MGSMRRLLTCVSLSFALGVQLYAGVAFAGNEAAAEALFNEGKKLAAQGHYAEACPKFAESNRLDRGAGTLIHLGDCYEKAKQLASAWATYKEASSAAQALGRKDWEKLAAQRAAALEPKLAHLTIKVEKPVDKLEVSRDGAAVSQASWGVPIPVDVGNHTVEATAPGFKAFKTSSSVAHDGQNIDVAIPKLEADASATAPPPTTPPVAAETAPTPPPVDADKGGGSIQRTIGFVVAGVGVAGVAVGAVTGLMAMSKSNDAKNSCPNDGGCSNQAAVDASKSAKTLGLISTIGFAAGGVGLAAGAALILTAPSAPKPRATMKAGGVSMELAPHASPAGVGVDLAGAF